MKNILFILAFSSILLSGCSDDFFSQTIEIDPPPYEKQLSFHLNLSDQDTSVQLILGRNFGILETVPDYNDFFVKGASAELLQDGQPWLNLHALNSDSTFVLVGDLPQALRIGSTYELRVNHPDYKMVNAIQVMPGDFALDSARLKRNVGSGQFGEKLDLVEVFLKDPSGVKNYYEVKVYYRYAILDYDPNTGILDTIGYEEYPITAEDYTDPNVSFGVQGGGLINDQFFDGQAYKLQVRISGGYNYSLVVQVRNVTEEFSRWSRSYQANYDASDNPLIEPVAVYNNLVNGLGVFSVAREKTIVVE